MTRRERLERKLELRQQWAEGRRAKASASFQRAHDLTKHIPMGQPILVGHHSEKGHRATLAKSHNAMRAGCESAAMATHHEQKAEGIERQLETCIFSDDDDATERLQEKIERLGKRQAAMVAANKIIRQKPKDQATPEKLAALQALGMSEKMAGELFVPDFCGRIGFPGYSLSNNNANIRRLKGRMEHIGKVQERQEVAQQSASGVVIEGTDWVRVTFAEKPDREILTALKAAGFRWGAGSWTGERAKLPAAVVEMSSPPTA
jgi:hypothetical protein